MEFFSALCKIVTLTKWLQNVRQSPYFSKCIKNGTSDNYASGVNSHYSWKTKSQILYVSGGATRVCVVSFSRTLFLLC